MESIIRGGKLSLSIEHQNDNNLYRGYHVKKQFDQNLHHHRNLDLFDSQESIEYK